MIGRKPEKLVVEWLRKYQKVEVLDLWGGSDRKRVTKLGNDNVHFMSSYGQKSIKLHKQLNKFNKLDINGIIKKFTTYQVLFSGLQVNGIA